MFEPAAFILGGGGGGECGGGGEAGAGANSYPLTCSTICTYKFKRFVSTLE